MKSIGEHRKDFEFLQKNVFSKENASGTRLWKELEEFFDSAEHVLQEVSHLQEESSPSSNILRNRYEGVLNALRLSRKKVTSLRDACSRKVGLTAHQEKVSAANASRQQCLLTIQHIQDLPRTKECVPVVATAVENYLQTAKKGLLEYLE